MFCAIGNIYNVYEQYICGITCITYNILYMIYKTYNILYRIYKSYNIYNMKNKYSRVYNIYNVLCIIYIYAYNI